MVMEAACIKDTMFGESGILNIVVGCKSLSLWGINRKLHLIRLIALVGVLDHMTLGEYKIQDTDPRSLYLFLASCRLHLLQCCVSTSRLFDNLLAEKTRIVRSQVGSLCPGVLQIIAEKITRWEKKECQRFKFSAKDCFILNCVSDEKVKINQCIFNIFKKILIFQSIFIPAF